MVAGWFGDAIRPSLYGPDRASTLRRFVSANVQVHKLQKDAESEWKDAEGRRDIGLVYEVMREHTADQDNVVDRKSTATISAGESNISGMQTLRTFLIAIDIVNRYSPYTFSPEQSEIMDLLMQCVLKQMFSEAELMQSMQYLLDRFSIQALFEDLIIQMQRRGGKTTIVSIFIAIVLLCLANGNINCFSSGKRISQELKNVVRNVAMVLMAHSDRFRNCKVTRDSAEQLRVSSIHGSINIFNAFPKNKGTLLSPLPFPFWLVMVMMMLRPLFVGHVRVFHWIFWTGTSPHPPSLTPPPYTDSRTEIGWGCTLT